MLKKQKQLFMENKKMKKLFSFTMLSFMFVLFSQTTADAFGLFYTNSTYPVTATGNEVKDLSALKKGTSHSTNILFLVEVGDAGIDTAAKNADIKKISYIDVNERMVFIFWRKVTVNVYGE